MSINSEPLELLTRQLHNLESSLKTLSTQVERSGMLEKRFVELEKKLDNVISMQWTGMKHVSATFNQITSVRQTELALQKRLHVLEQKLIDGGNNTYTVGGAEETYDMQKDPNVPEWVKRTLPP
jgi:hypothetical protein